MDNNTKYHHATSLKAKSNDLLSVYDDFVTIGMSEKPVRASPTQAVKNQDGVGSFESWDFVYQNLERTGYNKDLGERGDLLVQSLDLDALQLQEENQTNGNAPAVIPTTTSGDVMAEKRRVTELKAGRQNLEKLRTLDNRTTKLSEEREPRDRSRDRKQQKQAITTNGVLKKLPAKSTLKSNTTTKQQTASSSSSSITAAATTTTVPNVIAQNNNNEQLLVAGKDVRRVPELSKRSPRTMQKVPTPVNTQVIVSSPNEWSCRFCTFLNPDAKRVCEMCCRSKDFNLEATASHTPTCV